MATSSRIIHKHDNEFTLLKWPPQSPDPNPIEHLWDVVEREIHINFRQPTNLQQLRDAIMSIWTKISEECFQHLVESMPWKIKAVLRAKGGPTQYLQGVPNKVVGECTFASNWNHGGISCDVMSTSQGTYVWIEQTSEAIRETCKMCRAGVGGREDWNWEPLL